MIVVAIVGNAAEHWVAVLVAVEGQDGPLGQHRDRLQRPGRALRRPGAGARLVLPRPASRWPLVFNGFELGAILIAILVANHVTQDGESNWFEGVQLLALYVVLGLAFYYA